MKSGIYRVKLLESLPDGTERYQFEVEPGVPLWRRAWAAVKSVPTRWWILGGFLACFFLGQVTGGGGCALPVLSMPGCDSPFTPDPPAPIPDKGLRVLIVYESSQDTKTAGIVNSAAVRDYLDAKCLKVGKQPEWRFFDKDTDMSKESTIWQQAMARPRQSVPWLLISDGSKGLEGPMPATIEETLNVLKRFGG